MTLSDVTRPANGTYSYGYILMANTFGIKAKKQFTNTMHTYDSGASGNYCWTKDATAILLIAIISWLGRAVTFS